MPIRPRVPLRENDQGATAILRHRKPESARRIVFGISGRYRAGEGELVRREAIVEHRVVGEETVGICQCLTDEALYAGRRIAVETGRKRGERETVELVGAPF